MPILDMQMLNPTEKRTLAEIIYYDSGADLDYFSFIEITLALFEDISGFETSHPGLDLLNDLWLIYRSLEK